MNLSKRSLTIILLVAFAATIVTYAIFKPEEKNAYNFLLVERLDLVEEVSVTGKIEPKEKVDLAFQSGGKIEDIYVEVGNKVKQGQKLIELENDDLDAKYSQATAELSAANS